MRRVLGVDPGSAATGWALVEVAGNRARLAGAGVVRPRGSDRAARLADLDRHFQAVLVAHDPDEAAVEATFSARNPRTALALAEARGVLLAALGRNEVPVASYTPADVKRSVVGTGRAEKHQVAFMVVRLLDLDVAPAQDAADAAAVALTHVHASRLRGVR